MRLADGELCSVGAQATIDDFELLMVLGEGSFGKVLKVTHNVVLI
jgi:hypothetical protein